MNRIKLFNYHYDKIYPHNYNKNDNPKEWATDMDGNDFCIKQYKEVTEENWTIYKIKTCYAVIRTAEQKELMKKGAF